MRFVKIGDNNIQKLFSIHLVGFPAKDRLRSFIPRYNSMITIDNDERYGRIIKKLMIPLLILVQAAIEKNGVYDP